MYTVFLCGGIASGKSSVAAELSRLGAFLVDLDQVSRQVTRPGSPVLAQLAQEFGADVVDPDTGELRRRLLASRAFATAEGARQLERIELPAIREVLVRLLTDDDCTDGPARVLVVEVQLLDRIEELIPLVSEVICVTCPMGVRRMRAVRRGMDPEDFDARVANQPTDDYLRSHADTVLENDGTPQELVQKVRQWWDTRSETGWSWSRRQA